MGIGHSKVLKVNNGIREQFPTVGDKSMNELIVVLSPQTRTFPTHVEWVREEGVIVGSDIQDNGEDTVRVDTGS